MDYLFVIASVIWVRPKMEVVSYTYCVCRSTRAISSIGLAAAEQMSVIRVKHDSVMAFLKYILMIEVELFRRYVRNEMQR